MLISRLTHLGLLYNSYADRMVKIIDDFPDAKESNGEATGSSTHRIDEDEEVNGTRSAGFIEDEGHKKKRKNKDRRSKDGERRPPSKKRRHSLGKAARDPRDEASPVEPDVGTRSPSPVIDFDGLSRPSKVPHLNSIAITYDFRSWNP